MTDQIKVVGLGAGDIDQLPLGIYHLLLNEETKVFARTSAHPVVETLQQQGVSFESFDAYYEAEEQFEVVYEKIVEQLLFHAKHGQVIYAVPGHPMLAEKTVQLLLNERDVRVEVVGGQSYLDDLFTALKIDPIDGFQFVDGTSFQRMDLNYKQHLVFCQAYDQFIASEIKLTLLEDLPPEYEVTLIEAAGTDQEVLTSVPLKELDHQVEMSNLTTVYIPPVRDDLLAHTFRQLRETIAILRGPDGCPWDRKQTHESLRSYAVEEVYELIDAINDEDDDGIIEELGDVLLQVMLHSQIGEDAGFFTIDDVIKGITNKMIHRHPHVFSDESLQTSSELEAMWESRKAKEKGKEHVSLLESVPASLPPLAKAVKLQKKAAKIGFDWPDTGEVWAKLDEELQEVREAINARDPLEIEKELGDVLFVIANLARHYNVSPDAALTRSNQKFTSRFTYIEKRLKEDGKTITETNLEEMDTYWDEAKRKE
ncbi:nucleoside triphosphate pyrophosphohydrolase [Virgibacillus sp. W0181]|uniref:nucleoside triphosphate pyrophosphohydrolase n=1 Tax=Virgibacillus sp. W0181 TaxID=3391581 RepID=UPI003F446778